MNIDSFNVDENKYVDLTTDFVIGWFDEFNSAYFDNKLSLDKINVNVNNCPSDCLGRVVVAYNNSTNTRKIVEFDIGNKNKKVRYSEKLWCETILHEMIHLYQYQILNTPREIMKNFAHGTTFKNKMDEINAKGWNVTITSDMADRINNAQVSDKETKKLKNEYYLLASEEGSDKYLVALCKKDSVPTMVHDYEDILEIYQILNPVNDISLINKVRSRLIGNVISKDKLEQWKEQNYIQKIDSDNFKIKDIIMLITYAKRVDDTSETIPENLRYNLYKKNMLPKIKKALDKKNEEYQAFINKELVGIFYTVNDMNYFKNAAIESRVSLSSNYLTTKTEIDDFLNKKIIEPLTLTESQKFITQVIDSNIIIDFIV